MEDNTHFSDIEQQIIKWHKGQKRARIASGIFIILFGTLFLLHRLKFHIAPYLFSWQMIIIAVGIVALIRHKFKKLFGYIIISVGLLFLLQSWYPDSINKDIILPIAVILIGLAIIFKKRNHRFRNKRRFTPEEWRKLHDTARYGDPTSDDYLDCVNFFGGLKKNVTSQSFKGADLVTICGGTDLNLTNANFEDKVVLDISCVFAGTTLSIPNNWQINSDITTVFGGIEDKRPIDLVENSENKKVVVLQGTCFFGGIEINSFSS